MDRTTTNGVIRQGYLHKQSKHLKLWKIRYFVLTHTSLLYSKRSGKRLQLCLDLRHTIRVIDDQNAVLHENNYVLEISASTPSKLKTVYLSMSTDEERSSWITSFKSIRTFQERYTSISTMSIVSTAKSRSSSLPTGSLSNFTTRHRRKRHSRLRKQEHKRRILPKRLTQSYTELWINEILPHTNEQRLSEAKVGSEKQLQNQPIEALCFAGVPKEIRGRVWSWMLGNKLQINEELYSICRARARAVQLEMNIKSHVQQCSMTEVDFEQGYPMLEDRHSRLDSPSSQSNSILSDNSNIINSSPLSIDSNDGRLHLEDLVGDETKYDVIDEKDELSNPSESSKMLTKSIDNSTSLDIPGTDVKRQLEFLSTAIECADQLVAEGERSIKLISVDMPRTFAKHPLFKTPKSEGTLRTTEVLEAYICYRPDLGYVQGMSYVAAALCFHLDAFPAFKALVSLLSTRLLFDMYRLEATRTFHYINVFNQILDYELPELSNHFQKEGIEPQIYMVDWALTLFTRSLHLNLALRLWDVYLYLGTPFFFQASVGLLLLYEDTLLTLDGEHIAKLLHNFPSDLTAAEMFRGIAQVSLSCQQIDVILAGGQFNVWEPEESVVVSDTYPQSYDC